MATSVQPQPLTLKARVPTPIRTIPNVSVAGATPSSIPTTKPTAIAARAPDAGGAVGQVAQAIGARTAPPAASTPAAVTPPMPPPPPPPAAPGVSLTPTNAANDLRGQTITPSQDTDRYGIARQQFDTFAQGSQPAYTKALDDATRYAASRGQLGSGQLRTSYGDLANQRTLQLQTAQNEFLTNALNGSIDDAYKNLGIAQQQQQYQTGLQNQTFGQQLASEQLQAALQGQQFGQGVTQAQLQDQLTTSAANRAAQQLALGSTGSPSDLQLALSQLYGNNAAQAGNALAGLIGGTSGNSASQAQLSQIQQLLQQLMTTGANASTPTVPTVPMVNDPLAAGSVG